MERVHWTSGVKLMLPIKLTMVGIVASLILALVVETFIIHYQTTKLGATKVQLKILNDAVEQSNKTIKVQEHIAVVTDQVVTDTTKRIQTNTAKGKAIKAVVDNVTLKVANENLSSVVATAAYTNSMWDAYCTAKQGDTACATRQFTY